MKRLGIPAFLLATSLCTGCAGMSTAEKTWHGLHAVDVLQTLNGPAKQPDCFKESNPVTKRLIGENPSEGEVVAWGVGSALLHYGVTKGLEKANAPKWVRVGWQAVTITGSAYTVVNNHREGIRPWGRNAINPGPNERCVF